MAPLDTDNSQSPNTGHRPGIIALVMIAMIRVYQLTLSSIMGRTCRHLPTCSQYTKEAIASHGAWAGFWLGLFRISRCHPWGTHGIDNVPEKVNRYDWRIWRYRDFGKLTD
ncbi:MAG: membrane protein insertion efficiency factor YidD [Hyphomicrobiales bacterium]